MCSRSTSGKCLKLRAHTGGQMFKRLIEWSKTHYSHLPWRKKRSLYRTLVSEIMLQQTTVGTVVQHFERFLSTYPTLADLAASSEEEVTKAWQGLGYYRRARNLRKAAIVLQEEHGGSFPGRPQSFVPDSRHWTVHRRCFMGDWNEPQSTGD